MSAPAAREVEAQSLDFDDLEEISATGTLPIFKSRNVRYRSLELTLAKPVLQTVPSDQTLAQRINLVTAPDGSLVRVGYDANNNLST